MQSPSSTTSSNGCRSRSWISTAGSLTRRRRFVPRHVQLRLPDALVIATAIEQSADELLTTDRKWPTARALTLDVRLTHI